MRSPLETQACATRSRRSAEICRADIHRMAAINVASLAAFAGVVIAAVRL